MNLSDPHTESTIRLLDIVYDIHGSDKDSINLIKGLNLYALF